jgi:hypothetical protein
MLNYQGQQLTPFKEAAQTQRGGFAALMGVIQNEAQRIETNRTSARERATKLADEKAKQAFELQKIAYTETVKVQGDIARKTNPFIREAELEDYTSRKGVDVMFADVERVANETNSINDTIFSMTPNFDLFGGLRPPVSVIGYNKDTREFTYGVNQFVDGRWQTLQLLRNDVLGHMANLNSAYGKAAELQNLLSLNIPTEDFEVPESGQVFAGATRIKGLINRIVAGDVSAYDDIQLGAVNIPSPELITSQSARVEQINSNMAVATNILTDISRLTTTTWWGVGPNRSVLSREEMTEVNGVPVIKLNLVDLIDKLKGDDKNANIVEGLLQLRNNAALYGPSDASPSTLYLNPFWTNSQPVSNVLITKERLDQLLTGTVNNPNRNPDVNAATNVVNSRRSAQAINTLTQ